MRERIQAGWLFMRSGRAPEAEAQFRAAVAAAPDAGEPHAALALCLALQGKRAAALVEADQAVALDPDEPISHYARSVALDRLDRLADAQTSAREAIRLDPEDPDHYGLLGNLCLQRKQWADALTAADTGLALDPEHGGCTNVRSTALVHLGRRAEAAATVDGALARSPEDADTFASAGWESLHRGDVKQALERFREALRLSPGHEWARAGIVEALKARNIVYRALLGWSLWMSRSSGKMQVFLVIGLLVGSQYAVGMLGSHPEWAWFLVPLIVAYVGFVLLSWLGDPLFNLVLRLDKFGRLALSPQERFSSTVIGLLLLGAILAATSFFALRFGPGLPLALYLGTLSLPVSGAFRARPGGTRRLFTGCAVLLALLGGAAFAGTLARHSSTEALWNAYVYGIVAFTWLSFAVSLRTPN